MAFDLNSNMGADDDEIYLPKERRRGEILHMVRPGRRSR